MGRRSKPMSFFASLPPQLKYELRSQPKLETAVPNGDAGRVLEPEREPNQADLLRTQPPSEDEDDDEDEAEGGVEGGGGDDMDIEEEEAIMNGAAGPSSTSLTPFTPTDVVISRKRAASVDGTPSSHAKRRKGKGKEVENEYEGHPWDCTGLVPRYTDAASVPPHLKKYFFQRHLLWPAYSRLPLLMDDTGWFSVTPAEIASHIAERCTCDVVLDAFCGVGGNAIAFARTCERVIAMDNDPVRLRLARHNALHYGVADRIEFVLADYVEWAKSPAGAAAKEAIDVVFLSPPWGGPEYLSVGEREGGEHPTYPLSAILPIPGDELFRLTAPISPNIAYFLPRNVDIDELAALAASIPAPVHDTVDGSERTREWVEIEEEWVGDKLKAVTAYYGSLIDGA